MKVGAFVKIDSTAARDDDQLRPLANKTYQIFSFDSGLANIKCVGQTLRRTIILGIKISDLVKVNVRE